MRDCGLISSFNGARFESHLFGQSVIRATGTRSPSLFDLWAAWCGPRRVISPVFEKLSVQFPSVESYKLDVDAGHGDTTKRVGIRAVFVPPSPNLGSWLCRSGINAHIRCASKNGEKIQELVGAAPGELEVCPPILDIHVITVR